MKKQKQVRFYVYEPPQRHSPVSPLDHSPKLLEHLTQQGVGYEEVKWDGRLISLPNEPVMVRASSHLGARLGLGWDALVEHCQGRHVVFYDDYMVGASGDTEGEFEDLRQAVDTLLKRLSN